MTTNKKDRFDFAEGSEQYDIMKNASWTLRKAISTPDAQMLKSCYGKQSFGYADYKDHRKDKLETIRALILDSYKNGSTQRIHLYKDIDCTQPNTKIVAYGYLGGISSEFID